MPFLHILVCGVPDTALAERIDTSASALSARAMDGNGDPTQERRCPRA